MGTGMFTPPGQVPAVPVGDSGAPSIYNVPGYGVQKSNFGEGEEMPGFGTGFAEPGQVGGETKFNPTGLMRISGAYHDAAAAEQQRQLQMRGMQMQQAQQLQQTAMGGGPTAATGLMQQNAALAQQNAMAAARMSGGNPADQAAAIRNASTSAALNTNSVGGAIGAQKANEMNAAQNQLSGLYAGMRGQDMQQQAMQQQLQSEYMKAGMTAAQAQYAASLQYQQMASNNYNAAAGLNAQTAMGNANINAGFAAQGMQQQQAAVSGGTSAAAGLLGLAAMAA